MYIFLKINSTQIWPGRIKVKVSSCTQMMVQLYFLGVLYTISYPVMPDILG